MPKNGGMNTAEFDQQLAEFKDTIPKLYWALYAGCQNEGFTKEEAMEIVIATIQQINNKEN